MLITRRAFASTAAGAAAASLFARETKRKTKRKIGAIEFSSSDTRLVEGFAWAKKQALQYVFTGDPVGPYYEASLPGRSAFCMRDVSHQATGAHLLGLADWNLNMLRRFAASISGARDWCGYWEIDKWNRPAPVDYKSDVDFWYNLPANFDVLRCCWRQYRWTGNRDYLTDPVFQNFYDRTVDDYVHRWDKDGDGIMEGCKAPSHRGIASYNEEIEQPRTGADLVLLQAGAYLAYDNLRAARPGRKQHCLPKWIALRDLYDKAWWDRDLGRYYSEQLQSGAYAHRSNEVFPIAGFFPGRTPAKELLDQAEAETKYNVEAASYLPERFYYYGRNEAAYRWLLWLTDPELKRRQYPEVSFAVVGAIASGLMGIHPSAGRYIETQPRLTPQTAWASIEHIPLRGGEIGVRHSGLTQTTLTNQGSKPLFWIAAFPGKDRRLLVDGKAQSAPAPWPDLETKPAQVDGGDGWRGRSVLFVTVPAGATRTVEVAT